MFDEGFEMFFGYDFEGVVIVVMFGLVVVDVDVVVGGLEYGVYLV